MKAKTILIGFFLFSGLCQVQSQNPWGFEAMVRSLLEEKVDTVNSDRVLSQMENSDLVLLDARSEAEWKVSHLEGARRIGYESFDKTVLEDVAKDDPIIVYCSIGKRSEEVAHELVELGYEDVRNLFGGIFDWTNRGYEVVNPEGMPVKEVHPYNALWGIWINNYEKVDGSE